MPTTVSVAFIVFAGSVAALNYAISIGWLLASDMSFTWNDMGSEQPWRLLTAMITDESLVAGAFFEGAITLFEALALFSNLFYIKLLLYQSKSLFVRDSCLAAGAIMVSGAFFGKGFHFRHYLITVLHLVAKLLPGGQWSTRIRRDPRGCSFIHPRSLARLLILRCVYGYIPSSKDRCWLTVGQAGGEALLACRGFLIADVWCWIAVNDVAASMRLWAGWASAHPSFADLFRGPWEDALFYVQTYFEILLLPGWA